MHLWNYLSSKVFIVSVSELIRKVQMPRRAETMVVRGGAGLELKPHKKRLLLLWVCPQLPLAQLPLLGSVHHFQSVVFYLAIRQARLKDLWLVCS